MKTLVIAGLLLAAASARAANVCNGFIDIFYENAKPVNQVGDVITTRIQLGAGDITGGVANTLTMTDLGFDLSCRVPPNPIPACLTEGPGVMDFADNFTTTCPTVFSFTRTIDHVSVHATPPIIIPANVFPFCQLTFDQKVLAPSTNPAGFIEQVVSFDQALCDNGLLDSGGFQTGEILVELENNFDCFQVPRGKIPPVMVSIVDQFGDFSTTIVNLHRLCAPSQVNGLPDPVDFDGVHIAAYDIPSITGSVNHPKVSVSTIFGNFSAVVGNPLRLAVPTAKSLVAIPPPPPIGAVPNYTCYGLTGVKVPGTNGITVKDQFFTKTLDIDKRGPFSLCVENTLNNVPPSGLPATLVCNHTKNDGPFKQATPFINNIFEAQRILITQFDELCVPATVVIL